MANTLIFVLSGVIITGKIWESSASGTGLIQPADWGYAVLLWLYLLVRLRAACPCVPSTPSMPSVPSMPSMQPGQE